jgi:hypothetical protein
VNRESTERPWGLVGDCLIRQVVESTAALAQQWEKKEDRLIKKIFEI